MQVHRHRRKRERDWGRETEKQSHRQRLNYNVVGLKELKKLYSHLKQLAPCPMTVFLKIQFTVYLQEHTERETEKDIHTQRDRQTHKRIERDREWLIK